MAGYRFSVLSFRGRRETTLREPLLSIPSDARASISTDVGGGGGGFFLAGADARVLKEGELKKKSPSVLKGWQTKLWRLYPAVMMYSEPSSWSPKEENMIVLAKIVKADVTKGGELELIEVTTDKSNKKEVRHKYALKASDATAAEEWAKAIMDAKTADEVSRESQKHGVRPEFCKNVGGKERARLFQKFVEYDKDGNGELDTDEFCEMCNALGAKITPEEAALAMTEIDKDNNGACDFEEFLWFWSCTPEMGGYGNMTLQFLQTKLKTEDALANAKAEATRRIVALERQVLEDEDTQFKFSYSLNPKATPPAEAKISITSTLITSGEATNGMESKMTVRFQADPPSDAAKVCGSFNTLLKKYEEFLTTHAGSLRIFSEDGGVVAVEVSSAGIAPGLQAMAAPSSPLGAQAVMQQNRAMNLAVSWVKEWESSWSFNLDFNDLLAEPEKPVDFAKLLRHKCSVFAVMTPQMKQLALQMIPRFMLWPAALWTLLAGYQGDVQIAFDPQHVNEVFTKLLGPIADQLNGTTPANLRQSFLEFIESPQCDEDTKNCWTLFREAACSLVGVHSLTHELPAGKQAKLIFENFNPFPLLCYILEPVAKEESKGSAPPRRPISAEERKRLQAVFKKHDTDGDGSIDAKELVEMARELGGKLSDDEAQKVMSQIDIDGNGTCDFEEFCVFWSTAPGAGGYSAMAAEVLKMQIATSDGFSDFKKKFLSFFPGKDTEGLHLNGSLDITPGMTAFGAAKTALRGFLRKMTSAWVSTPSPCIALKLEVKKGDAEKVSKALTGMCTVLDEILGVLISGGNWSSQVENETTVVLSCDVQKVLKNVMQDQMFVQIAGQLLDSLKDLEVSLDFMADCKDIIDNSGSPLVSLLKAAKFSLQSQVSKEGKELASEASGLKDLLQLFVGVDVAMMVGYHEKYLSDVAVKMHEKSTIKWFTMDDARQMVEEMMKDYSLPEAQGQALRIFTEIQDSILGLRAIGLHNVAIGTPGHDLVIEFKNFNPFTLLRYILEPINTSDYSAEIPEGETTDTGGGAAVSSPKGKAKTKAKAKASTDSSVDNKGSDASPEKAKAKAKGSAAKRQTTSKPPKPAKEDTS